MKQTLIAVGIVALLFTACHAEDNIAVPEALAKNVAQRTQQAALAGNLTDEQLIEVLRQRGLLPNAAQAPQNPFGFDAASEEDLAALMTLIILSQANGQEMQFQGQMPYWGGGYDGSYGYIPGYEDFSAGGYGWADGGDVYRNDYTGIGTGSAGGASYVIGDGFSVLVD